MATSLPWMDGSRSQALHFDNLRMFFVAELYQNRLASMQLRRGTRGMLTS
jgi:hypothetical protein